MPSTRIPSKKPAIANGLDKDKISSEIDAIHRASRPMPSTRIPSKKPAIANGLDKDKISSEIDAIFAPATA